MAKKATAPTKAATKAASKTASKAATPKAPTKAATPKPPAPEEQPQTIQVTPEILANNPDLAEQGIKAGDVVEFGPGMKVWNKDNRPKHGQKVTIVPNEMLTGYYNETDDVVYVGGKAYDPLLFVEETDEGSEG